MMRLLLVLAWLALMAQAASAQRLVVSTSDPAVWIHSTFTGVTMTLFGNIEPDAGGTERLRGPFDVVIVVRGPAADRIARRKSRQLGIMINAEHEVFEGFPAFFRVLSSRRLEDLAPPEMLEERLMTMEAQARATMRGDSDDPEMFGHELVRLMEEANLFHQNERGVQFLSETFYSARITLPANVPNGNFLAQTYVFQNGEIVAERAQRFTVQKTGFERFLGDAARQQPLLYGLAVVALAVFTGWLGGVVFRR